MVGRRPSTCKEAMESETPVIGKPASIKLNFRQTKGFPALLIALGIVMTYFMMCILGGAIDNDVLIFLLSAIPTMLAIGYALRREA